MSKLTVRFFQLFILTGISCVIGFAESSHVQARVTRYGVSFSLPPVKHLVMLDGLKRWVVGYNTPYDISYNWNRPNQWIASFRIDFIPNTFAEGNPPLTTDAVKTYLTEWNRQKHFALTELLVNHDELSHKESYWFRLSRKFTNVGNAGEALQYEGYLMVHPFDHNFLVILSVIRDYDLEPVTQDPELHDMGMDWLASVTFSEPSPLERKVMREMKTWIVPPK